MASRFVFRYSLWFNVQNYLFKLSRTIYILSKIKLELLVIYEFPWNRTLTIKIHILYFAINDLLAHPVSRNRKTFAFPLLSANIRTLRFALPLASTSIVMVTFENTSWRFVPYQRHVCIISASLQASLASCCLSYRGKHVRKRLSCSNGSNQKHTVRSESIISKGRERRLRSLRSALIWPT